MAFSTIIFDLDGTLIDSSDGVVEAVNYSLIRVGEKPRTADEIKKFIGYPLEHMYPHFTDAPLDELHRHFQTKAAETVVSSTVELPGVSETLEILKGLGIKMAIGTTKIRFHVDGIVNKLGWGSIFAAVVGGDEVSDVKPAPDVFNLALKRLDSNAADSVVVGDTINDLLGAHAVPMKMAALPSPYGGSEKLIAAGPDFVLSSLREVLTILSRDGKATLEQTDSSRNK